MGMRLTARGDRIDWSTIRDTDRPGRRRDRLAWPRPRPPWRKVAASWWNCPFHDDKNPSFACRPGKRTWKCCGCGEHGDAAALVMKLKDCTFPEAVALPGRQAGPLGEADPPEAPGRQPPVKAPEKPPEQPSGLPLADALGWSRRRRPPLDARGSGRPGLSPRPRTDRGDDPAARLGWTPGVSIPESGTGQGSGTSRGSPSLGWTATGWRWSRSAGPRGAKPKYAEAFRDRPALFPAPSVVRPGKPLVIVEGEFDALLLGQELADLAAVVTLGIGIGPPRGIDLPGDAGRPSWYRRH